MATAKQVAVIIGMAQLSAEDETALRAAIGRKGKYAGFLLAKCPNGDCQGAAAWQGAMMAVNPYKVSVGRALFMSEDNRKLMERITAALDRVPKAELINLDYDRQTLTELGVW